uniref:CSON002753 protein n=1 Tax=Culicoides sonorensis TaxID=179676 RepID=A0A336MK75_CULSO
MYNVIIIYITQTSLPLTQLRSQGKLSHKLLYFIVLQSFYALTSSQNSYSPDNAFADIYFDSNDTILCEFDQTINITDGSLQVDRSWLHDGLHYGLGYYAKYNYTLIHEGIKIPANEHIRGCICLLKPCIYACCEPKHTTDNKTGTCLPNQYDKLWWDVGMPGEEPKNTEITKDFYWKYRKLTCKDKHYLDPNQYEYDAWWLAQNGSIYVEDDESFLNYDEHCVAVDEQTKTLLVLKCYEPMEASSRFRMLGIGMLLSVPFLLVTFIVYAVIPELRNVHGMSLMSYVGGLTVGYTFLATIQIIGSREACHTGEERCYDPNFCTISGYIIYFSFMLSFFWLNTMCFDIYWTFRGVRSNTSAKKNFMYYCVYAWGMASFITILALSIDISNVHQDYKPGMYYTQTCFLSHNKLVEFLYLYMILLVLVCSNITFFVVTALRIKRVQRETAAVVDAGNSGRHSRQNYDNYRFMLYLRLFIIMGVTWSMELLSWVISHDSPWFYASDLVNCLQGVLIFLLVVCNDKVRRLVIKRYYKFRGIVPPETGTTFSDTRNSRISSSFHRNNSVQLENRTTSVRSSTSAKKNFMYYCVYAWGMASFITILALSIDISNVHQDYKPGMYYTQTCFLSLTAIRIRKSESDITNVVNAGSSRRHSRQTSNDTYRVWLYFRLFIIMGVTWFTELISWVVSNDIWFYATDIVNCLQGVLIFLLAVCNGKVRRLLIKRFRKSGAKIRSETSDTQMLVSVPFFLVTMIVHAVIPELRNVHGMSLMSYVGGLTVAYLFMGTNKILGTRNACLTGAEPCYDPNFCTISGYIIYFSIMLSFFWLNTMCFDIFSTFRHIRISKAPKKKFLYYCIYAWGMASLLTIITISIDASNSISDDYKPGIYYTGNCFLSAKKIVQFIYLHMILLVLISLNTTFFVITAIKINRVRSETDKSFGKNNNSSHSNPNHNKDRFILYLLNWSMELISWMIDGDSPWFYLTDSINMLQGPLIFIFVLCTKHSRSLIIKRYKTGSQFLTSTV